MTYHIDKKRFEHIRSHGYQLGSFVSCSQEPIPTQGDNVYHLIFGDRAECFVCESVVDGLIADTPAELEAAKLMLEVNFR